MTPNRCLIAAAFLGLFISMMPGPVSARDAAFMDPGAGGNANTEGVIKVEPKPEIDSGESILNISKRVSLFFVNSSTLAVTVEKISASSDGNVTAEIDNDDCTKQRILAAGSRCSVEVTVTPSTPGPWSAEVLMTHNGGGRIARARITGKTSGTAPGEKKDMGLALSSKDNKPIEFGDVQVGDGRIVRSALMVNDSPEPITIYSIDVIAADDDLQRLAQGCAVDLVLKPGESCPVTLVWEPKERGIISTDLIIRHSGKLGFAVISIRGAAKDESGSTATNSSSRNNGSRDSSKPDLSKAASLPLSPSANDVVRSGKIPSISSEALGGSSLGSGTIRLIGTVGNRAVILKPDGTTGIVEAGDLIEGDNGNTRVIAVGAKSIVVANGEKKKTINLQAAPELTDRARGIRSSSERKNDVTPISAPSSTDLRSTPSQSSAPLPSGAPGGAPSGSVAK